MHNAKNWELVEMKVGGKKQPIFLPILAALRCTAGVNLVRSNGSGIDTRIAFADVQERGFTVIDPEKYDYLKMYPCTNGTRYEDAWTSFEVYGNEVIRGYDMQGFNDFRLMLMREQALKLPHEHFIKKMIVAQSKRITKYSASLHNPEHKALYDKASKQEKLLKQALQAIKKDGFEVYGEANE
jgi:hypothetical protein